jgi:23S rRNA (adenine2503-C2)-methyltransferase
MSATDLLELTPDAIVALAEGWGQPAYRGRQLAGWLFRRGVVDFDAMSDLPRALRDRLRAECTARLPGLAERRESADGSVKLVLALGDGRRIQTVVMPDDDRLTVCLSTQVGCGFACAFCCTGTMGLVRNLSPGEIVGQVLVARGALPPPAGPAAAAGGPPGGRLTHVVFMGMGEPLANYAATVAAIRTLTHPLGMGFSPRRVTVSTVGLVGGLERLARENLRVNLAVSLHAASDEARSRLMPVNRGWGLEDLLAACRRFPLPVRQRLTFEYTLLAGVNDAAADARLLVRRLQGLRCKVNLIPFNPWPGSAFRRPPLERILAFQRVLLDAGLTATIRWSKGEDVGAACGQLRTSGPRAAAPAGVLEPAGA